MAYKLRYLFTTILFFLISHVNGQYFQGGFTAGITASQIDGDNMEGYHKIGFTGGIFVKRKLDHNLGIQADFKYTMKGAAKVTTENDRNVFKTTLHYVEIPFVLLWQTSEKIEFELGPGVGYLALASEFDGYGTYKPIYPLQKFDYTANFGISYLYRKKLKFNTRFCYSLRAISTAPGNLTIWGKYGQFNNLIDLSAYYTL